MEYNPSASQERSPMTVIQAQSCQLAQLDQACILLNAVPCPLVILNAHRQAVLANRRLQEVLGVEAIEKVYGQRPGELLKCRHACETTGGCGASEACRTCGAAKAITYTEHGTEAEEECRITQQESGEALDLRITTTPFRVGAETYTILAITDISHEKRRASLERIFFHDLMNTVGAIQLTTYLLTRMPAGSHVEECRTLERLTDRLVEEIQAQRDLAAAESNDLQVQMEPLESRKVLEQVAAAGRKMPACEGRVIVVDPEAGVVNFHSDRVLLTRVLGNLIKNALEAAKEGQTVTVGCRTDETQVEFWVHNPTAMTRAVQLQVFQRSFSTKGKGRGLGLYSIKLLTERYLKGTVSFNSSEAGGTVFRVRYPLMGE